MRTPKCHGVRIGSHFYKNAYMHEQTTIGIHEEEVPKLVYTLFWCKPVNLMSIARKEGILGQYIFFLYYLSLLYCHVLARWGLQQTTLAPGSNKTPARDPLVR